MRWLERLAVWLLRRRHRIGSLTVSNGGRDTRFEVLMGEGWDGDR